MNTNDVGNSAPILQFRYNDQRLATLMLACECRDAPLPDVRIRLHQRFDVLRVVVLAADDDHVLGAAADVQLALVDKAHVAASHPCWLSSVLAGKPCLED
jgi:hypothetical protein